MVHTMERSPNEIYLLIFSYLNKFQILQSFDNLNFRIERLIVPYKLQLDVSCSFSIDLLKKFIKHILPIHGQKIRELSMKNDRVLRLIFDGQFHIAPCLTEVRCLSLLPDPYISESEQTLG